MKTKVRKEFLDTGFGFPVRLLNVPMIHVRGVWTPNVNYKELAVAVLHALSHKPSRLTGNELRFIRTHFEMTLQAFARRFGVSHVAVMKWERAKAKAIAAIWATEKDLRLFVEAELRSSPAEMVQLYKQLETRPLNKPAPVHLEATAIAA